MEPLFILAGIVALTRTVSASPSSVGDAGHGFCASCLRVLRKVCTLVWSGIENSKSAFSRSLESVSTVDVDSHDVLRCKQEGDVQVTEKVGFSKEQRTLVSWSSLAVGQRGGHSSVCTSGDRLQCSWHLHKDWIEFHNPLPFMTGKHLPMKSYKFFLRFWTA